MSAIESVICHMTDLADAGGIVEVFTQGFCFDFAYMLQRQFGGDIVYNMNDHYLLRVDGKFYDVTGEVERPDEWVVDNEDRGGAK